MYLVVGNHPVGLCVDCLFDMYTDTKKCYYQF